MKGKWKDVIKECDLNGDGRIDFHEFFTAAVDKQKIITKENLQIAFNTFDTDGNGTLDIEEFKTALPSNNSNKSRIDTSGSKVSLKTKNTNDDIDGDQWVKIISEVDKNGDGVISFTEFCDAIESFINATYSTDGK
jgi:calcium-dependent protein kinase